MTWQIALVFVLLIQVFTFFELLSDILRNNIPMSRVGQYHFFLTPKLIYDSTPVSVMVAVLITFAVLSKQNEVTAFKACGVSLYRLAMPVLLASLALSGALFAFDYYIVPDANLIEDGIRNEMSWLAMTPGNRLPIPVTRTASVVEGAGATDVIVPPQSSEPGTKRIVWSRTRNGWCSGVSGVSWPEPWAP